MVLYVRIRDRTARQRMIRDLEQDGFIPERISRQEILESHLPLTVDIASKQYDVMGNVTCAAAAATQGHLMGIDEFYHIYRGGEVSNGEDTKESAAGRGQQ